METPRALGVLGQKMRTKASTRFLMSITASQLGFILFLPNRALHTARAQ